MKKDEGRAMSKKRRQLMLVPVIEPLNIRYMWEHTPLDYYRYGEYPRFIRPVGAHQPRVKIIDESGWES